MAFTMLITLILLLFETVQCQEITRRNDSRGGCSKPADVVFVLDASNTIWPPHFRKQLQFVSSIIQEFSTDPTIIRSGVMTFSHVVRVEFGLGTYPSADAASRAVSRVTQLGGNTRTDLALRRLRAMFDDEGRPERPRIGIVITDGQSDIPSATAREAKALRNDGVRLFSIGVGDQADSKELRDIAGKSEFTFSVENYDRLNRIKDLITSKACLPDQRNWTTPDVNKDPGIQNIQGCSDKPADVLFILDSSRSISMPDFRQQLKFVKDTVALFRISEEGTHTGLLTFGDVPKSQFDLDRYSTVPDIQRAVDRIVHQAGSTTDTARALRYARLNSFAGREHREEAVKIAVVVTDGKSDNSESTAHEAKLLRNDGVVVYAIGVGIQADRQELDSVASAPPAQHVFMADNYSSLGPLKTRLVAGGCAGSGGGDSTIDHSTMPGDGSKHLTAGIQTMECLDMKPADIVFALPSTIDDTDTTHGLRLVSSTANRLKSGSNQTHFGLAPRLCHAISGFTLEEGLDSEQVSRHVNDQRPTGRVDETAASLRYLRDVSFGRWANQRRSGATKMAVLVIDGKSVHPKPSTIAEANRLKEQGVLVIVVDVGGKDSTQKELKLLAGCPTCLLSTNTYSSLYQVVEPLASVVLDHLCITKPKV